MYIYTQIYTRYPIDYTSALTTLVFPNPLSLWANNQFEDAPLKEDTQLL